MPTYQYACTACGEQLEAVQSFTDAALTECPACQGALRKVYSAVGVVFKGSGFYKNDSRSSATSGAKSKVASESSGDSSSKGDTASKGSSTSSGDSSSKSDTPSKSDKASKSDASSSSSSTSTPVAKTA